jgi:hypothetical protein
MVAAPVTADSLVKAAATATGAVGAEAATAVVAAAGAVAGWYK